MGADTARLSPSAAAWLHEHVAEEHEWKERHVPGGRDGARRPHQQPDRGEQPERPKAKATTSLAIAFAVVSGIDEILVYILD